MPDLPEKVLADAEFAWLLAKRNGRSEQGCIESAVIAASAAIKEELQAAFDHILNVESKLPGLHDMFDHVFPGWKDSHRGPLGDGPSYAHDVKPLEEELATAEAHPEYGIDVDAVRAALEEARADAARKASGS